MADIRINSLPTTASASSSDDFLALDGATNGTRKLNAYSPTFGGNLTVSGTDHVFGPATNTVSYVKLTRNGSVIGGLSSANTQLTLFSGSTPAEQVSLYPSGGLAIGSGHTDPGAGNLQVKGTGTSSFAGPLKLTYGTNLTGTDIGLFATSGGGLYINAPTTKNIRFGFNLGDRLTLDENTATFATNLTVSGGTITGGASGMSLASGGTNQNITLTPSGTGVINSAFGSNLKLRTSLGTTNVGTARIGAWYSGYVSDADFAAIEMAAAGTSGGDIRFFTIQSGSTLSQKAMLAENGNFLINTAIDTGYKLVVKGSSNDQMQVDAASGSRYTSLYWSNAGTNKATAFFDNTSTEFVVGTLTAGHQMVLRSGGNTTALTLDSSQNATFAGTGQQSFNGIIQVAKTAAGANSNLLDLYNKGTTNNTSSGIAFSANNASSAQRTSAEIRGIMTVTTAGSEESELWFSTRGAGVASGTAALKIANTGDATFAGKVTVGTDVAFPAGGYGLLFGSTRIVEVVSDGINIVGSRIRISTDSTPASASATGTKGDIKWDASYIYVCTATNTWKRVAIATW